METFTCLINENRIFSKGPCLYEKGKIQTRNGTCPQCNYYIRYIFPPKDPEINPYKRIPEHRNPGEKAMKDKIPKRLGKGDLKNNLKWTKKARFRLECLKRSPIYKEFRKLITTANRQKIPRVDLLDYISGNREQYRNLTEFFCMAAALDLNFGEGDLAHFFLDLPSITVLTDYSDHEALGRKYLKPVEELKYEMGTNRSYRDLMFGWDPIVGDDKAVSIRINLNRGSKDIINDVTCLLDTLRKYGKYKDPDYRPRLESFEKYFRVYDLRQRTDENPKGKGWGQIAREVLPEEGNREKARRMVRGYYDEAERYIREEIWRR